MSAVRRIASVLLPLVALLAGRPVDAQKLRPNVEKPGVLRVCADPDNMPASNQKGEGYENKIAELVALEWHSTVEYAWWPIRRGFFARALNGRYCDVAITAPSLIDMAGVTKPYFRSAYVIVYRKDSGLNLTTLDDPAFKKLRIGVNLLNADAENTPPAMALSAHGVVGNLVGFTTFFSEKGDHPQDIIDAVADKKIDVAIVWGPLAGYFVRRATAPLVVNIVESDSVSGIPFAYNISMGVRRRDHALQDSLQTVLDRKHDAIIDILKGYDIPMLPIPADTGRKTGAAR